MLGEVLGTVGAVGGIGIVAGASGALANQTENIVKDAKKKLRERG